MATDWRPLLILGYLALYPSLFTLAIASALKTNYFNRERALVIAPSVGFVAGAMGFGWSGLSLSASLSSLYSGALVALSVFAITYFWIAYAEQFWRSAMLAGLMTAVTGPLGLYGLLALVRPPGENWLIIRWEVAFFVLGALSHILMRVGDSILRPDYYSLNVGRILLVLLIVPITAPLAWCTSLFTGLRYFR